MIEFLHSLDKHDLQILACAVIIAAMAFVLALVPIEKAWQRRKRRHPKC